MHQLTKNIPPGRGGATANGLGEGVAWRSREIEMIKKSERPSGTKMTWRFPSAGPGFRLAIAMATVFRVICDTYAWTSKTMVICSPCPQASIRGFGP